LRDLPLERDKVFTKILYDRLLPHANVAGQHYKELYLEPNSFEGEIKEDRNSGGRMG
jgi:hypothetical protein